MDGGVGHVLVIVERCMEGWRACSIGFGCVDGKRIGSPVCVHELEARACT
jgi:hypothetical protein